MQIISAVAIGKTASTAVTHITDPDPATWGTVRQYITGLVDGLAPGRVIPTDYVIEYRERTESQLTTNPAEAFTGDLIFAMSTTVVTAAQTYTSTPGNPATPIVGIVSDPGPPPGEDFKKSANICGVSAQRHQTADKCFDHFIDTVIPKFTNAVILCKPNYHPSDRALRLVQQEAAKRNVSLTLLKYTNPNQTIPNWLNTLPTQPAKTGILVLPVDLFFANAGGAGGIIDLAQNTGLGTTSQKLPTFFFATDWVQPYPALSALGAYGVPQDRCGELMADMVDLVWTSGVPAKPDDRWPPLVKNSDFQWVTSETVANNFGYKANKNGPDTVYPAPAARWWTLQWWRAMWRS
jgi:hypothetical protein